MIDLMNPQQKSIANVFLDMVAAIDVTGETSLPAGWMGPFAERLTELEAITKLVDDESGVSHLDMTPLVSGAGLLVGVLVDALAAQAEADRLAVIRTIREHIAANL